MAESTEHTAPGWVPSTDALSDIPADLLGPIPAEIRLGQNVLTIMGKPPELGDTVTVVCRLRITREGKEKAGADADGEIRHFRSGKVVASWLKGEPEPPNSDDEQPGLFDEDGEPVEDCPEDDDDIDNVVRPPFSNVGE